MIPAWGGGPDEDVDAAVDAGGRPRWGVTDEASAEWALRKLAAARAEMDAVRCQAGVWRDEIDVWEDGRLAPLRRRCEFFEGVLSEWAVVERERSGRAQFVLPSGTVRTRLPKAGKVRVVDEGAVLAWAAGLPADARGLVERRTVSVSGLGKVAVAVEQGGGWRAVTVDGEVVPGVAVDPPAVSVSVSTSGGDA